MAFSGSKGTNSTMSDINVTPFVDVMLVLLIIFMVTAPLIQQGFESNIQTPKAVANQFHEKDQTLELLIDAQKKIFIGKREISFKDLKEKLATNQKLKKEKKINIRADQRLSYGFVVKVLEIVNNAGIEQFGLIADLPEKG